MGRERKEGRGRREAGGEEGMARVEVKLPEAGRQKGGEGEGQAYVLPSRWSTDQDTP